MKMLGLAIAITSSAFRDKTDKGGNPYILHCIRVMQNSKGDEDVKCAAIMHDLVEDTDHTLTELALLGFSSRTIGLLALLTHDKDVPYMDYIKAISTNPEASEIKRADLKDNSDISRLKDFRKKDFDRLEKYSLAYRYLSNC